MLKSPTSNSSLAALTSVPWCCILPATLSLLGLAGAAVSRLWLVNLVWVLLPLSAILIGRAFWLLYVKQQGAPWARRLTWTAALLVVVLWAPRLWTWIAVRW